MITYYRALRENLEKKTARVHSSAHGPEPSSSSSPSLARYRRFCPWRFDVRLDCHPCQVRCASFPSSPSLARYRRFCPWRFDVRLDCHPCQVRCASFPSSPSPLRYRRYCPWRFDVRLDCHPCQVRASFSSSPSPARYRRYCPWRFDVRLDCNPCQVRASFSSSPSPARYRRYCPWRFDVRLDCNPCQEPLCILLIESFTEDGLLHSWPQMFGKIAWCKASAVGRNMGACMASNHTSHMRASFSSSCKSWSAPRPRHPWPTACRSFGARVGSPMPTGGGTRSLCECTVITTYTPHHRCVRSCGSSM